jgi:hypothetical protein
LDVFEGWVGFEGEIAHGDFTIGLGEGVGQGTKIRSCQI